LRELVFLNEKLQKESSQAAQNSSFSFQGISEKPSPMPSDFPSLNDQTTDRKNHQKSKFFTNFETPLKTLSEKSEGGKRSQSKMMRSSILEGLKFIHENDENPEEFNKIKELEKKNEEVTEEIVMPHLLENKTRERSKLREYREVFKKKKLAGKKKDEEEKNIKTVEFKKTYKGVREKSAKKMKEALSQDNKLKKIK